MGRWSPRECSGDKTYGLEVWLKEQHICVCGPFVIRLGYGEAKPTQLCHSKSLLHFFFFFFLHFAPRLFHLKKRFREIWVAVGLLVPQLAR